MNRFVKKDVLKLNAQIINQKRIIICYNFIIWLVINFFPLVLALVMRQIINNLEGEKVFLSHSLLSLLLLLLGLLQSVFIIMGGKVDTGMRFDIRQRIRKNLILNTLKKKRIHCHTGEFVEILTNDVLVMEELISVEIDLLCRIIFAFVSLIVLLQINFRMTLMALIPMFLISQIMTQFRDKLKKQHHLSRDLSIEHSSLINDVIVGREAVQLLKAKKSVLSYLSDLGVKRKHQETQHRLLMLILNELTDLGNLLSIILLLLIAINEIKNGHLVMGDLLLFFILMGYVGAYNGLFTEAFSSFQYVENLLIRLQEVLKSRDNEKKWINELLWCQNSSKTKKELPMLKKIDVNMVLENTKNSIHFTVREGECLVVCGQSGSGKTRLLNALLNRESYEGDIIYEDDNVLEMNEFESIGFASQNPKFLDDTIVENVHLGRCSSKFKASLEIVNLYDELIHKIESGEKIGINGKRLSEGQRQRLAIARALTHTSNLLILDDSTSLLDAENETQMMNRLIELKYMIVMVSNRKNVLKMADKILLMNNDHGHYLGRYHDMKKNSDEFRSLMNE